MANETKNSVTTPGFSLTKLAYIVCGISVAYDGLNVLGGLFMATQPDDSPAHVWIGLHGYFILMCVFLLATVITIAVYRPSRSILNWQMYSSRGGGSMLKDVALGVLGGIVAFLMAVPLLSPSDLKVRYVMHSIAYPSSLSIVLRCVLVFVALPIASEVVFRGIVLRTISDYVQLPAAIFVSALLFAHFWPAFDGADGVIVGVVSAFVYSRARSLVPSVVTNMVFTMAVGGYAFYRLVMKQ